MAAVVRPPLLIAGLALPLFSARRDRRGAGVAVLLILALPLLVTARNAAVGDPVFIASQGGLNFHLGNGREADGISATFKEAPGAVGYRMLDAAAAIAERDAGRTLRPSDVSRHWARRAWRDIGDAPGRWLALLFKKTFLFPSAREIPNNHDPVLFAEHVGALRMPGWGIWWPMAIVGAWVSRRHAPARFVTVCALAIGVVTVLFFVNARFRMPVVPLLLVLSAGGIVSVARAVRERRVRSLAAAAALATGAAVVACSNPYNVPREPWVGGYVLVAEAERNRGEPVRSLRWVERALELEPALYPARLAQIELLRRMGRIAEASDVAERVLALRPDDAAVRHQNAILLDLADRPADALVEVDRALALEPTLPGAEVDRAVILARLGRREDALDALDEKIREGGSEAGRARMIRGQIESGGLDPP